MNGIGAVIRLYTDFTLAVSRSIQNFAVQISLRKRGY
jgi:hypothetical protein